MEVKFKKAYSCQLVLDLERERRRRTNLTVNQIKGSGMYMPSGYEQDIEEYTMKDSVRLYCQMGVSRRWHDYMKELTRNINAIDAGEIDKVTMPELITDVDSWSDEDKLVYKAMKEAEIIRVKGNTDGLPK